MAVIKITNWGGEAPSLSDRALKPDQAAIAKNLYPRVNEFRPLQEDTVVVAALPGGVSNPKTLFRLERKADGTLNSDPATGWTTSSEVMSYAKGQINDDLTGRTYYSFDTGPATPPRVKDAGINPARDGLPVTTAVDKVLGVPAPVNAPKVTLIVGDELTPEEFDATVKIKITEVAAKVRASVSFQLVGAYAVDATAPGYLATAITGVVATEVVTGGGTGSTGGTVTIGGSGTSTPTALTDITLGTGGTITKGITGWLYTAVGGAVTTMYENGQVYLWRPTSGDAYAAYKVVNGEIVFA